MPSEVSQMAKKTNTVPLICGSLNNKTSGQTKHSRLLGTENRLWLPGRGWGVGEKGKRIKRYKLPAMK